MNWASRMKNHSIQQKMLKSWKFGFIEIPTKLVSSHECWSSHQQFHSFQSDLLEFRVIFRAYIVYLFIFPFEINTIIDDSIYFENAITFYYNRFGKSYANHIWPKSMHIYLWSNRLILNTHRWILLEWGKNCHVIT